MSTCQRCKTAFTCGMADTKDSMQPCWCTALPALAPDLYKDAVGCYCPACLRELVSRQSAPSPSSASVPPKL